MQDEEDLQTQEAFDVATGQAMALTPPRVEDQALSPRSEAGRGLEPLELARPSFESALERFRSAGQTDVNPDDPALFNAYRRSLDYLGDMALGGLDLSDAAFRAAVGIVSQALPENQERSFARDLAAMPEAFMGYSPGRIQAGADRVAEGVAQVGRNLQQPGPMPTLGSNLGNLASGSPSPRRGPANVPRFTVRGENTALPSPTFGNMKLRDLYEEDQWESQLDLDFTAEDDAVIGFYDSFDTGPSFTLGYAPNLRVHDLADIVLGRRTAEEALDYIGMDPEPEVLDYVNTRISSLQENPEFQEYVERYRGLNEPYDPTEFIASRSEVGREGNIVATFRSPIPDVLNQIEFPSAGIKGSQLLKAFQDSPSVRGSELRSLGVNIDPQKRYSEEEARRLFEGRLWTATASLQSSPMYGGYQRQKVLDPVVDYFELTVNASRPDAPNFKPLSQHFDEDTLSHTRASVREDSRGEYILPEEFQSDLLQQGFVPATPNIKQTLSDRLSSDLNYYPDVDWDDYIVESNFTETLGNYMNGVGRATDFEGGDSEFHFIWNALEEVLDPATYNAFKYDAAQAAGEGLPLPNLREYFVPKNYAEPPIQRTVEGVRLAFDGLLAEAQRRGISRIVIPPFERIVAERFTPGSAAYFRALQPSSGFYATYKKGVDQVLREYEKEFGRENFNTRLVDMDYEPVAYVEKSNILDELVDPSSSNNSDRRVVELPSTSIEVNFKGALDAGYDFSSPRFAEGGLVQNYNSGGVVSMEEQMSLFDMGGLTDDGAMRDPVSGNEVPPGSMASEVRDDVPAMLSEGEYIVPADVVRYYGVKFFEDLRMGAKSGLNQMEQTGRIGGEPVDSTPGDEPLTPEEMQMLAEISGMYGGGMVRKGYQQGGMVNKPFTPVPNYTTPGFSLFQPMQPAAPVQVPQTETVTLYGPNGEIITLTLPTDQERYNALIGQGYSTEQQVRQPTVQGGDSGEGEGSNVAPGVVPTAPGLGADAQLDFKPLGPEEYNAFLEDPLKAGAEALKGKDYSKLFAGAGNLALGPLGGLIGGAVGAGMTAQNVAQARAASQIAKAKGLDTTALDTQIDSYISGLPNLSRVSSDLLASGDQMAERFFQTAKDLRLGEEYGPAGIGRDFFAEGPAGDAAFNAFMEKDAPPGFTWDPNKAGVPILTYNEQTKKFEDLGEVTTGGGYVRVDDGGDDSGPDLGERLGGTRIDTGDSGTPIYSPGPTTPRPVQRPDRDSGGTSTTTSDSGGGKGFYESVTGTKFKDTALGKALGLSDDNDNSSSSSSSGGGGGGYSCYVATALTQEGYWSNTKRLKLIKWCMDTKPEDRFLTKLWRNGYVTFGKKVVAPFASNKVVKWLADGYYDSAVKGKRNVKALLGSTFFTVPSYGIGLVKAVTGKLVDIERT